MKNKLAVALVLIFLSQGAWAIDQVAKRQNITRKAITACQQIVDDLNILKQLKDERAVSGDFVDTDFSSVPDLVHLDAGTVGNLFDFVVPSIDTNYLDAANGNRNKNILLQMKK